jgi:hypothetical protein
LFQSLRPSSISYGYDAVTQQDFSHRKAWVVDRMKFLAGIFAIDVCAFAILANHFHNILRTRPDIVASWSDHEVAVRWLQLCPRKPRSKKKPIPSIENQISALLASPHRIAQLRKRFCSLSWFMGRYPGHPSLEILMRTVGVQGF